MNILIAGGSGFIGKNLISTLSNNYDIRTISLRDENWKKKIIDNQYDVFINMIGKAHDHNGVFTEKDYYYANFELVKEIYSEYINSKAKLLIHISSVAAIEEYESVTPLTEESVCNPQSIYGKTKREAEKWLLEQKLPEDKKIIILRPPMVHGPGDKGNLKLLYKFVSKGIPYPLSSFDNKRSFISINNFIFFIEIILKRKERIVTGIYHVSDDESISTKKIISIISKVEKKSVINISLPKFIVKGIATLGDILPIPLNTKRLKKITGDLLISNEKIKTVLGIDKLPYTAEEGLKITIKSFKNKD
ncbi:epimerase [Elizabethkingia miricola]|uniref:Nucleoside-diphosphate-sugar epimerase n=1 Tax=Elizabethkingia miricola TaxID=172045 RepID=A0ABY3NDT7_ELIMR|nr:MULTISPECIES: NAD-dependent epimerase/dehydratase family protein [Elizabethkingia]OBS13156.1 epimerase [Elizabethkingia miricola]TYO89743.1 nucleoside-diphosphate-sugar epimerase [Elizabethkingia miricola]